MSARPLSVALLGLGALAMGASQHLGSPWPGVVLCCLSLVPWALDMWFARGVSGAKEAARRLDGQTAFLNETMNTLNERLVATEKQGVEHGQQINSLRNAASLRGTLGG